MEKSTKTTLWIEEATRVTAKFSDYDGESSKWNNAFYQIWRYQMTWDYAYEIKVYETRSDIVVSLLIKNAYRTNVEDMMETLGYKNVQFKSEHVGVVETYNIKLPEANDMFTVIME